jgi:hypothetical protein
MAPFTSWNETASLQPLRLSPRLLPGLRVVVEAGQEESPRSVGEGEAGRPMRAAREK